MSGRIELHGDLHVDPAREAEAIDYFVTVYRPTASKFEGYLDVHLLKLTGAVTGSAPPGVNDRFSIAFSSEALRQAWVASDDHQKVWGTLDTYLTRHDVSFLLFTFV